MSMIISLLVVLEFFLFLTAIFLVIRERCEPVSESIPKSITKPITKPITKQITKPITKSIAYASIITLAMYSVFVQVFFFLDVHPFFFLVDIGVGSFSVYRIVKGWGSLKRDAAHVRRFLWEKKILVFVVVPVMAYLFLQVLLAPPDNSDSLIYNLARVLMFIREGTMFPENYSAFHQVAFPLGTDVLSFLFLRFGTDFGLGLFSFVSYIAVIVGTYSIVGSIYEKKTGVFVSIVIASLTGLVLQATTMKNDIPCAAAAVVIFLAGHEFIENRKPLDLYMILTGIVWGLMVKGYFAGFALPFILFYIVLLWKKQLFRPVWEMFSLISFKSLRKYYTVFLPIFMILCMAVLFGNNLKRFGNVWGDDAQVKQHQNKDGVFGAVVNAGRYIAQSAEIPMKYGYRLNQIHDRILKENIKVGCRNEREIVDLAGKPVVSVDYSWYGPLGFFLIIPCILFSIFWGKGYTRLIAWTLFFYLLIVSYQVAWMPWNGRFFSLLFAGSGLCVGYVSDRFFANKLRALRILIILVAIYSMMSATLQNDQKLTIPKYKSVNLIYNLYRWGKGAVAGRPKRLFKWWDFVSDRDSHYTKYYPPGMYDLFRKSIEPGKRVLVLTNFAPVFPLLLTRPDIDITLSGFIRVSIGGKWYLFQKTDDFKTIHNAYDYLVFLNKDIRKSSLDQYMGEEELLFYTEAGAIFRFKK